MTGLRTGQVTAAAGVNRQTLRYYERIGLLAPPDRTLGGHRLYPAETVPALHRIRAAQHLGFSLAEITACTDPHTAAQAKLADVERRIADLLAVRDTLRAAIDAGCTDLAACSAEPDCPLV